MIVKIEFVTMPFFEKLREGDNWEYMDGDNANALLASTWGTKDYNVLRCLFFTFINNKLV